MSLEHNKIPRVLMCHQNQSSVELVGWLALYIRYKSVYIQSIIIQMMRRLKMTLVCTSSRPMHNLRSCIGTDRSHTIEGIPAVDSGYPCNHIACLPELVATQKVVPVRQLTLCAFTKAALRLTAECSLNKIFHITNIAPRSAAALQSRQFESPR